MNIYYKASVKQDFKQIAHQDRLRIIDEIENELKNNPHSGKKLTGPYRGMYSLRVGDYRVIYSFYKDGILILRVAHRKDAYK